MRTYFIFTFIDINPYALQGIAWALAGWGLISFALYRMDGKALPFWLSMINLFWSLFILFSCFFFQESFSTIIWNGVFIAATIFAAAAIYSLLNILKRKAEEQELKKLSADIEMAANLFIILSVISVATVLLEYPIVWLAYGIFKIIVGIYILIKLNQAYLQLQDRRETDEEIRWKVWRSLTGMDLILFGLLISTVNYFSSSYFFSLFGIICFVCGLFQISDKNIFLKTSFYGMMLNVFLLIFFYQGYGGVLNQYFGENDIYIFFAYNLMSVIYLLESLIIALLMFGLAKMVEKEGMEKLSRHLKYGGFIFCLCSFIDNFLKHFYNKIDSIQYWIYQNIEIYNKMGILATFVFDVAYIYIIIQIYLAFRESYQVKIIRCEDQGEDII